MKMSHYDEVPQHLQSKIISAHKAAKEGKEATAGE
jgi:hypothetical protein